MYKQFFAETCQATVSMVLFATQQRPHVFFYIPLVFEVSSCTDSLLLFKSRWKPFLFVGVKLKLTVNKTSRYKVILQDLNIHVNVFLPCCICCNNQWQYFSFHIDVHIFLLWMLSDTLWTKCFFVFLLLLPKYCSNKISSNDEWIWLFFFFIFYGCRKQRHYVSRLSLNVHPFLMYVKNFVKFGTNVHYDSWMNWLEFGGQKSEVKLTVT